MSLFNQSVKAVSAAILEIADSAGASADSDMQTRAFRSLAAAVEHWNTRSNWDFLYTEGTPVSVSGAYGITGASASAGNASAALPAGHGFQVDDVLQGGIFLLGTRVTSTATNGVGFSRNVDITAAGVQTSSVTAVRDLYALPTDWKTVYSVRLLGAQRVLRPVRRRVIDRSVTDEFVVSTPEAYDIAVIGGKGKLRLVPAPLSSDALMLRYYRRMTVPSAVNDGTTLDIPQDYEPYLIAIGKWHFLTDKKDGAERAQTWFQFGEGGMLSVLRDQTRVPDEDLGFFPGQFDYGAFRGPNATPSRADAWW